MPNYRKILYLYETGVSQRQISVSEHMSRNTVSRIIKQAQLHSVCSDQLETLSESEVEQLLRVHINEPGKPDELYEMPDYDYYSKELKKPGVTITLLWEEYVSQCRKSGKVPYQKTQFGKYFRDVVILRSFCSRCRNMDTKLSAGSISPFGRLGRSDSQD